jgi:hypothetical protein
MKQFAIKVLKGQSLLNEAIQSILYSAGYKWFTGDQSYFYNYAHGYITCNVVSKEMCCNYPDANAKIIDPTVTPLSDLCNFLTSSVGVKIELNSQYTVYVSASGIVASDGSYFPLSTISNLRKALDKVNEKHASRKTMLCPLEAGKNHFRMLQGALFSLGFSWLGDGDNVFEYYNYGDVDLTYIVADASTKKLTWLSSNAAQGKKYAEMRKFKYPQELDAWCSAVEISGSTEVGVDLGTHTAVVTHDEITVGCQTFPTTIIDALERAVKQLEVTTTIKGIDVSDLPKGYVILGVGNTFKVTNGAKHIGIWKKADGSWSAPSSWLGWVDENAVYAVLVDSDLAKLNNK